MKIIAVIPCLNEERTIIDIVRKSSKYVDKVIVVDDQSIDKTVSISIKEGAKVFQTSGKRGAGKALWLGIRSALKDDADIIVTLDGDGQHNPDDIPRLLNFCSKYDSVIASRFLDSTTKMPLYRRLGIWLITFVYNLGSSVKVKDSQCGLRAFNSYVFKTISIEDKGFGYSTEVLVKLRQKGYSIKETPCIVYYDKVFGNNSTINPISHGISVLLDTIKWRFQCEVLRKLN